MAREHRSSPGGGHILSCKRSGADERLDNHPFPCAQQGWLPLELLIIVIPSGHMNSFGKIKKAKQVSQG